MKKFLILIIFFSYLTSVTGVSVIKFYCCGKLKSTNIAFNLGEKNTCNKKMDDKNCCKHQKAFYKISDNHFASNVSSPHKILFQQSVLLPEFVLTKKETVQNKIYFNTKAPPRKNSEPIYLNNCNFRI